MEVQRQRKFVSFSPYASEASVPLQGNLVPSFVGVDTKYSAYSHYINTGSPTELMSPLVSPSDPATPNDNIQSLEHHMHQSYLQYYAHATAEALESQSPISDTVTEEIYMTSPMETSPTESSFHNNEVYHPSDTQTIPGMPFTIPESSMPEHALIDLQEVPRETLIKIVGDGSWLQCGLEKCITPGHLYRTMEEIEKHIEEDIGKRRYSCAQCATRFKNRSDCLRHINSRNNPDKYHCSACPRRFGRPDALRAHCSTVHNVDIGRIRRALSSTPYEKRTQQKIGYVYN